MGASWGCGVLMRLCHGATAHCGATECHGATTPRKATSRAPPWHPQLPKSLPRALASVTHHPCPTTGLWSHKAGPPGHGPSPLGCPPPAARRSDPYPRCVYLAGRHGLPSPGAGAALGDKSTRSPRGSTCSPPPLRPAQVSGQLALSTWVRGAGWDFGAGWDRDGAGWGSRSRRTGMGKGRDMGWGRVGGRRQGCGAGMGQEGDGGSVGLG